MKKLVTVLLAAMATTFAVAAISCQEATYYTVTFDADGGLIGDEEVKTVKVKSGKKVSKPTDPTKEGWAFDYWANGETEYNFSASVTSDLTLTAIYTPTETYTLTYEGVEGAEVVCDIPSGSKTLTNGQTVSFTIEYGAFYAESATVFAGEDELTPDADGVYTFTAKGDTAITLDNVKKDRSSMSGSGTSTDAYVITRPVDLLYIAEQVNDLNEDYSTACYVLGNDIDVKGEELEIIGDGVKENAYFSGVFNGNGYTISNFTINSDDSNYVGLFGVVMANMSGETTASVYNVNLDTFTINASANSIENAENNLSVFVGSLVGYGMGANIYLCNVTNGEVNVSAAGNYFGYAGGIVGLMQATYAAAYDARFLSSIVYCQSDVEVSVVSGRVLAAGGVVGYTQTDDETAAVHITNCYSTGGVSGAIRAGGIVGNLGSYTSVINCYATGDVEANTELTDGNIYEIYVYSYGGGLIGYAENNSIVSDSFAAGSVDAFAAKGGSYAVSDGVVAGGDEAGATYIDDEKYVATNCHYAEGGLNGSTDFRSESFIRNTLRWPDYDWAIAENNYPVINTESSEVLIELVIDFSGETVGDVGSITLQIESMHVPFAYLLLNGDLSARYVSKSGLRSYGFYFDEAHTQKVLGCYVPTSRSTIYVAFADYSEIAGEYAFAANGENGKITLQEDGTAIYSDGALLATTTYTYNGKYAVIEGARLARYFEGAAFDYEQYSPLNFKAEIKDGTLIVYDGVYFTAQAPLTVYEKGNLSGEYYLINGGKTYYYYFYADGTGVLSVADEPTVSFTFTATATQASIEYSDGETQTLSVEALKAVDAYKGEWKKSASVNKTYTFDGVGNWSYEYYGYERTFNSVNKVLIASESGGYALQADGSILLDNGTTVRFDENGFLQAANGAKMEIYYGEKSYKGAWTSETYGSKLTLNGIVKDGVGSGRIDYADGTAYRLTYNAATTDGYVLLYSEGEVFGYFYYNAYVDAIYATMYIDEVGDTVENVVMVHDDEYAGAWIGDEAPFTEISFNGLGNYAGSGKVTIGKDSFDYSLVNSTLDGSFSYQGVQYSIQLDEVTETLTLTANGNSIQLIRKDIFHELGLVTKDNATSYVFDGRGGLTNGGALTVVSASGEIVYRYKLTETGASVYENSVTGETIATIQKKGNVYQYVKGGQTTDLYVKNKFTGEWAISGGFGTLSIGPMDLSGNISGYYLGVAVTFTESSEDLLTFQMSNGAGYYTVYVYALREGGLAISLFDNLYAGDYSICEKQDEMFGTWTINTATGQSWTFDGLGGSAYVFGAAQSSYKGTIAEYNYYYLNGEYLIWNTTYTFRIDKATANADGSYAVGTYVNGDKGLTLTEIDAFYLYLLTATDENGVKYEFSGTSTAKKWGVLTGSDGSEYQYKVTSFEVNSKIILSVKDKDGNVFEAEFNYGAFETFSDLDCATLTFNN